MLMPFEIKASSGKIKTVDRVTFNLGLLQCILLLYINIQYISMKKGH